MTKRIVDVSIVLLCAVPLAPIGFLIAFVVKLTSYGPALHWSRRIGANNREFLMPKFRTMRVETPDVATHLLSCPERWLTPVGPFLRKSSLDELPQVISVLLGDMSLVGPRPALHNQADLLAARRECGVDKLCPGITGWAQVNGRDELSVEAKVKYDYEYLVRRSFAFDLKIIWMTIINVIQRKAVAH